MSGCTRPTFCVTLTSIGLEILEFNSIWTLETGLKAMFNVYPIRSSKHWYHPIKFRLKNLRVLLIVIWIELKRKRENREITALNHLISSELFNFPFLIINQKASEGNTMNFLRLLFTNERIEPWKTQLDTKHNEIYVRKRVVVDENGSSALEKTYYEHHFPFSVSLSKWKNIVAKSRSRSVKIFLYRSVEKFIIIYSVFVSLFNAKSLSLFCHDSIHTDKLGEY